MGGHVAHARGGFAADHDGHGALDDDVGRADADAHVADGGGGHEADEDGGDAGAGDRAANMGDRRHTRGDHRADVHVGDSGGEGHGMRMG